MKLDNKTIISLIENLEINETINIPYRFVNFELKNEYSKLNTELKPNLIIKVLTFLIFAFLFSFIGVILVSIITNGNRELVGFGIIPFLLMFFFTNSLSKSITKILFKKRINEFHSLVENTKMKTIENELNSKNQNFIQFLYEIKNGKSPNKSIAELKKQEIKEDLEMEFISKPEYDYLIKQIGY